MYKSILTNGKQRKLESDKFLAIKLYNEIEDVIAILTPFVGTKVATVSGAWTKKFDTAITPIREHRRNQRQTTDNFKYSCQWLTISKEYKSLYLKHKGWFVYEEHEDYRSNSGEYNELGLYIATVNDDNILTDLKGAIELKGSLEVYIARRWDKYEPMIIEAERLEAEAKAIRDNMPYYMSR